MITSGICRAIFPSSCGSSSPCLRKKSASFFIKAEIFLHPDLFCQRDQGIYRKIWYRLCLCLQSSLKLRFQEQKYLAGIGYFLLNCPVETTKYPKTAP
jgi:hypothetical protein